MSSYSEKWLRATLILPAANFPGTSSNTLTLVGYRTLATIQAAANYPWSLDLTIYGMQESDMNAVTILWQGPNRTAMNARALVQLEASADGATWTQVFEGNVLEAAPDYTAAPDANLHLLSMTGYGAQIAIAPASSYRGSVPIAQIAQNLASAMGFTLENNGVTGNLANPYYPGTYMDQFRALCRHANLDFYFDGNATLAICPSNVSRSGKPVPVFSPTSGLIGFPTIQRYGIHVDTIFTPALTLGGNIQISGSIVPSANGTWFSKSMTHSLSSLMPDGPWFSSLECTQPTATAT